MARDRATASLPDAGRRRWCLGIAASAAVALWPGRRALAHNDAGPVEPPRPSPGFPVTWHDGSRSDLRQALVGQVTALQTMFVGCSAVCPIQGALFAEVQSLLASDAPAGGRSPQLLSLSIDAVGDDPAALRRWLQRQGAGPSWRAGVPGVADVERLLDFLRARAAGVDSHTGQVYLFDERGSLVMRTADFPAPEQVAALLRGLARRTSL